MNRADLVTKFSQVVGVSKAEEIVADAEATLGLTPREHYSDAEVRDLCEEVVADYDGYIAEIANEVRIDTQARERFETLLENVPDPAVVVTFDDGSPVVQTVNSEFEAVFGYGREAARGAALADLIHPEGESTGVEVWSADDADREVTRVTATGEKRTFLKRTAMATTTGGAVEGYAVYTDITDRIERERDLDMLTQLFSRVFRHNVRTELNVVTGHLSAILSRSSETAVLASAETALGAADRLLSHTEKARDVEKLVDADRSRVVRSLGDLVGAVLDRRSFDADATVRTDLPDASVRVVEGFEAAVENAVENAVVHGGTAPTVDVTAEVFEDSVVLRVTDDGPGIDPVEADVLSDQGETPLRHGSGVGLWVVDWYVTQSNGDLSITGSEDGTTVRMTLERT